MRQGILISDYRQPAIISCTAWSPDGQSIAIGDIAGRVHLWNVQTGQMALAYQAPSGGSAPWPSLPAELGSPPVIRMVG